MYLKDLQDEKKGVFDSKTHSINETLSSFFGTL